MSSFAVNETYSKPIITGGIAFAINKLVLKQTTKESLYFASSVAAGVAVGSAVGARIPITDNKKTWYNEKLVGTRTIEVGSGLGASVAINRLVNNNDVSIVKQAGVILLSDFLAEYCCDYLAGRRLGFLI